jgi:hypothetical protein
MVNNFTTNEDIGFQFLRQGPNAGLAWRNTNVLLFNFRFNIFIGVGIIKAMRGFGSEWDGLYLLRYTENAVI